MGAVHSSPSSSLLLERLLSVELVLIPRLRPKPAVKPFAMERLCLRLMRSRGEEAKREPVEFFALCVYTADLGCVGAPVLADMTELLYVRDGSTDATADDECNPSDQVLVTERWDTAYLRQE